MTTRSRRSGNKGQPVRPIPAEQQGDRQKSIEQQSAAPLARAGAPITPQGGPGAPTPQPGAAIPGRPVQRPDVFGPTQRPNEPLTAGAAIGPGKGTPNVMARDPDMLLRAMARAYPHPDLIALLARRYDV